MMHRQIAPIPPMETGYSLLARLAPLLRPKAHLTVSQWAERYFPGYDPAALPFLAEIMDALSDPETAEVGDMGPAQAGKSLIGEAWIGWSIEHDPADMLVCQPDKALMQDFVVRRINHLIAAAPILKQQLLPTSNADNIFLKQFRGMLLTSIWPVGSQFRARPVPRGWLDDYDQFPDDIDGQGDAIGLLSGRQTTFEGRDTKLVSSSPANDNGGGIEAFIASGTDEHPEPACPHCGERSWFEIDDLKFERGSAEIAEQSAHVICPKSGCILLPEDRHALLASCAVLPNRGFVAAHPERGKYRRTFRRSGLLSFTSWGSLARQWHEALEAWEARQDEGPLRTFRNVRGGKNYRSQLSGEEPIRADKLRNRREEGWRRGTVPRGVRVVNAVVDVQHDRFEVALIGSGVDRETWLIDRFPIDVLDDGLTQVTPFVHKEHWKVLLGLFDRKLPLAEKGDDGKPVGYAPILSVTVDTGGSDRKGDQATEGAKWFWNAARALAIHPTRVTLMKGGSNPKGKLMPPGQFADQKGKGGAKKSGARLWISNVHAIKNMIDARLRREAPGPGYVHFPEDLPDEYFDELTAEELIDGKWKKIRARNETLDHLVQGEVAILRPPFAQSRTDMRWVPKDFRIAWPTKAVAKAARAEPETEETAAPTPAPPPRAVPPRRSQSVRKRGWIKRK